jgi:hypothetical protein
VPLKDEARDAKDSIRNRRVDGEKSYQSGETIIEAGKSMIS